MELSDGQLRKRWSIVSLALLQMVQLLDGTICLLAKVWRTRRLSWHICQRKICIFGGICSLQIQWNSYISCGFGKLCAIQLADLIENCLVGDEPQIGSCGIGCKGIGIPFINWIMFSRSMHFSWRISQVWLGRMNKLNWIEISADCWEVGSKL